MWGLKKKKWIHLGMEAMFKKNLQIVNAREDVEKREPSYTVGGNVIGTTIMENSMEAP